LEEKKMKKILAFIVALVMVCALSVSVYAESVSVFSSSEGEVPTSCEDPWGSFGVIGDVWGRGCCCDISLENFVDYCNKGYNFTYVFTGTPMFQDTYPHAVINADWDNGVDIPFVDIGDGKYQATIALADILSGYGITAADVETFCVQNWTGSFKLLSVSFTDDAAAPAEDTSAPAEDTTAPAEDTTAPAEDTTAPVETTTPADTGIVLAVLPMAVAAAAVVISKRK